MTFLDSTARRLEAAVRRPKEVAALQKAVERVIKKYKLTPEIGNSLLVELSTRRNWIFKREWDISCGFDVNKRRLLPLDNDTAAMLFIASKWKFHPVTFIKELSFKGRLPSTVRWPDLNRYEKDTARRQKERFETQRNAFHKGNPTYPYIKLVEEYIEIIERAVAKDFSFSRGVTGYPWGPMMEALMSALDLALFCSGAPSRETVASFIKRRREKLQKLRRNATTDAS